MSLDPGALPTTLGGQFKRHLGAYLAGGALLAVFQLALNRIDWLSKAAIDDVFGGAPEQVTGPAMWIFGLAVLAFACRVGSRWYIFNAGRDAEYELRALLLHRLHRLGTAFYRTMSAGEIMSRSSGDLQQVRLLLGFGVLNIVNVVFAFASALQVMVNISVRLTLVSFVVLPVMVLTTRTFSRQMFTRTRHNQESLGKLSEVLQTNLAGVRVVRSFALEKRERRRFAAANEAYLDASLALARLRGLMFPMVGAASTLGVLAFFWYGASLLQRAPEAGGITRGDFFAFWLAYGRMTWPMIAFGFSIAMIQRGRAGYVRLEEIFRALPEVTDGKLPHPKEVVGSISVRGLSFSYGDRKVVDDVSFEVPAGKSIALVGRTGSGKSTIAMLLARLLPTPAGAVFVDGNDVCDLPLSAVRANVGYAQQDAFLFSTTVSAERRVLARRVRVGGGLPEDPRGRAGGAGPRGGAGPAGAVRHRRRRARRAALRRSEAADRARSGARARAEGARARRPALRRRRQDGGGHPRRDRSPGSRADRHPRHPSRRRRFSLRRDRRARRGAHSRAGNARRARAEPRPLCGFRRGAVGEERARRPRVGRRRAGTGARMSAQPKKTKAASTDKGSAASSKGKTLRDFHEEERLGRAYDSHLLKQLWPFMKPHARFLYASVVMILLAAGLNLVRPLVMGRVVAGAQAEEPGGLMKHGITLALVVVAMQVLTFVQMYTMQIAGARSMADLRAHLFEFMQRLELRYYDRTPVGRLVTRATNDVDAVGELFASGVLNAIGDLVALVGIIVMMVVLDLRMSLISFASLPLVAVIVWFVRSRARQAFRDIRVKTARLNAFLNEQVSGMPVVQAYARESTMAAEFDEINVEYRDANKKSIFYEAILDAAIEMVGHVVHRERALVGGLQAHRGRVDHVPARRHLHPVHQAVLRAGEPARAALHGPPVRDERRGAHLQAPRRARARGASRSLCFRQATRPRTRPSRSRT